jgi:molybdenum cofactor cytidylyltransferase
MDMDDPERYEALRGQLAGYEIPDEAECEILLRSTFGVTGDLLQHSRTVAAVATDIAARLRQAGHFLDLKLVRAGALLHDVAKGEKDHARRGAQYLQCLGFDRVAQIVARHVDLLPAAKDLVSVPEWVLDEAAVVFIADKHISGNAPISLGARFDRSLKRFGTLPAARANIERRRQTARVVRDRIEGELGVRLGDLVAVVVSGGDVVAAGGEAPK